MDGWARGGRERKRRMWRTEEGREEEGVEVVEDVHVSLSSERRGRGGWEDVCVSGGGRSAKTMTVYGQIAFKVPD